MRTDRPRGGVLAAEVRMAFRDSMKAPPLPKHGKWWVPLMDARAYLSSVVTSRFDLDDAYWDWTLDTLIALTYWSNE